MHRFAIVYAVQTGARSRAAALTRHVLLRALVTLHRRLGRLGRDVLRLLQLYASGFGVSVGVLPGGSGG